MIIPIKVFKFFSGVFLTNSAEKGTDRTLPIRRGIPILKSIPFPKKT